MIFYLGTHEPYWVTRTDVPLFLSVVRLRHLDRKKRRRWPRARGRIAIDSGGFSQLSAHGSWDAISDEQYISEIHRANDEIGNIDWAAIKDHMCEPQILAKTGKTVRDHQLLTIQSFVDLTAKAPTIAWTPVLQGWDVDDYERHVEMYRDAGVELRDHAIVGVGSVCRRQATSEGAAIMRRVAGLGIRMHAFGVKTAGLRLFGDQIASADSMAWSFAARRRPVRLTGCTHVTCANCYRWAHQWRSEVLEASPAVQTAMPW